MLVYGVVIDLWGAYEWAVKPHQCIRRLNSRLGVVQASAA
jgi:hypothetical protein